MRYVFDNTSEKLEVIEISWERIFLNIVIRSDMGGELDFRLRSFDRRNLHKRDRRRMHLAEFESGLDIVRANYLTGNDDVPVKPYKYEDGCFYFQINIAAANGRSFLENGKWQFVATDKDGNEYNCCLSYELAQEIDVYSRIYRYDRGKYAYTFSFSTYISDNDENVMSFCMDSFFMIEHKKWHKRKYVQEATTKKGKINRIYMFLVINLIRGYYHLFDHIFPKRGKNVLLMTETKPYIWGNLLYIDKRLKERGLDKKFNISYSCRAAVGSHMSAFSWMKVVTLIAKQDYIFVDDYVPVFGFFNLGKKTKLIQVWHAGVGFKSVGFSRFGKSGTPFPAGSCHKKYDKVITGSGELVHVYEEVFGIEKEAFLPVGMARLDDYLDEKKISAFREEFYKENPGLKNKKIILFAPTFRGKGQSSAYYDYDYLDFDRIYDFCGDEYVFAMKMHPFVINQPELDEKYKDRILDFTYYENINDLYYVTEILITDYSSAYYEFALMQKPIIFYTPDRVKYTITRGVHKDVKKEAPGKVCDTFDEMMDALINKDFDFERTVAFREYNFNDYDGHAADKAIDAILPLTDEERRYEQ